MKIGLRRKRLKGGCMNYWKTAFILGLLICLNFSNTGYAEFNAQERTTVYDIQYKKIGFFHRVMIKFFGVGKYKFLNWKEITLKELFFQDTNRNKERKVVVLSAIPTDFEEEEPLYLKNVGEEINGFVRFIEYEDFNEEAVKKLLSVYNYIYKAGEGKKEFYTPNIFEADTESIRLEIVKKKKGKKYKIEITAFNSKKEKIASITIILDPKKEVFESIDGKLEKEKILILLTIKPTSN